MEEEKKYTIEFKPYITLWHVALYLVIKYVGLFFIATGILVYMPNCRYEDDKIYFVLATVIFLYALFNLRISIHYKKYKQ